MASYSFNIPNNADTRFQIASVSKSFTASAILLLEERNKLKTTDALSKYIPDYPHGESIRLEHLLTHCSGIPNVNSFPEYDRESYIPHTLTEILALFKDKPLDFEPGTKYRYSNSNYNVLAYIIEKVSGESFGNFVLNNIAQPLNLSSVHHHGDAAEIVLHYAEGTEPEGLDKVKFAQKIDWSIKTGNGSLVSTAHDLCKFATGLFTGKLLSPRSLEKILHKGSVFPFGWSDKNRSGHKSKNANGRSPGFISSLDYFLEDTLCVSIVTNSYSPVGQMIAPDICNIVFNEPFTPPSVAYLTLQAGQLESLVGTYKMPENYYVPNATLQLINKDTYLEAQWNSGYVTILYSVGKDEFMDRTNWARIHLTRDNNNVISGFIYSLGDDFSVSKLK